MTEPIGRREQRATRAAFFVSGCLMAAWAPMVPLVQRGLKLDDRSLGFLLLCMGLGSVLSMASSSAWAAKAGCRIVLLAAAFAGSIGLILASLGLNPISTAVGLLLFGAGVGGMDVVMNLQAIRVEDAAEKPMMSGFHGFFSLGGFFGAGGASLVYAATHDPGWTAVTVALPLLSLMVASSAGFLTEPESGPRNLFALPRGVVLVIGLFCFVFFLGEGSVLDWSGVMLTNERAAAEMAGTGYTAFAIAMTLGRFTGDAWVKRVGPLRALAVGSFLAGSGFASLAFMKGWPSIVVAYFAIGLGAANTVPVCFTAAGRQTVMPTHSAVAAISTLGYAGILAGPALIGFVAHAFDLRFAFGMLGVLLLLIAAFSRSILK